MKIKHPEDCFRANAFLAPCLMVLCLTAASSRGDTLWYSGDFDGETSYGNYIDTSHLILLPQSKMFERFVITNNDGWEINALWSNNTDFGQTNGPADWSIRSGMSHGNGGIVLFGSTNMPCSVTPTGRFYQPDPGDDPDPEYSVLVSGLHILLPPGEYWINVTPYDTSTTSISGTTGTHAVGAPPANGHSAFWWWSTGQWNYYETGLHFSMGVAGIIAMPRPTLQISRVLSSVVLAWPGQYTNFVLEASTANLMTANSWEVMTNASNNVGTMLMVTNQLEGQARFFRLKQQ